MCALIDFNKQVRHTQGRVIAKPSKGGEFRVWGCIDGVAFDRVFPSVAAWRAYKRLTRADIEVLGMRTVQPA